MQENKSLIGYKLNDALLKLTNNKEIIVNITKSPFSKENETSEHLNPVIVKHVEDENKIILTVSYFK